MRKILSLYFNSFLIVFAVLSFALPVNTFAAPPPPVISGSESFCDGTTSKVRLTWDYDATWDNGNNQDYYVTADGWPSSQKVTSYPYIITNPSNQVQTKGWKLERCDGGILGFDPCSSDTGTYTTISCAGGDPQPDNSCYYCRPLVINGNNYDGTRTDLSQCLSEYKLYPSGANCNDSYIGKTVCLYNPANDTTGFMQKYMTLASNGGVCSTTQKCSVTQGCVAIDAEEPLECSQKNKPCTTQSQCNSSKNCSKYWCINQDTNKLASDEDLNRQERLICKYFNTKPSCPEGADCDNPFGTKATSGMTCDKASDCLSGVCESGKCDNENLAPRICAKSGDGYGCRTAIGYFYADPERFSQSLLRVLLGLSGGILLVLIIFNGYKIMTSQGDPEKIKDAREGIIAAIAGILLIIFSLSILQLITVDIIGIPGFR